MYKESQEIECPLCKGGGEICPDKEKMEYPVLCNVCNGTGKIMVRVKSTHPEATCQKCKGSNITWYADNSLFNQVNGSPNGILCPACFEQMAKEKGINIIFKAVITDSLI